MNAFKYYLNQKLFRFNGDYECACARTRTQLHFISSYPIASHRITSHLIINQHTCIRHTHTHSRTHRRLLNTKDNAPAKQAPLNGIKTEINYHFD